MCFWSPIPYFINRKCFAHKVEFPLPPVPRMTPKSRYLVANLTLEKKVTLTFTTQCQRTLLKGTKCRRHSQNLRIRDLHHCDLLRKLREYFRDLKFYLRFSVCWRWLVRLQAVTETANTANPPRSVSSVWAFIAALVIPNRSLLRHIIPNGTSNLQLSHLGVWELEKTIKIKSTSLSRYGLTTENGVEGTSKGVREHCFLLSPHDSEGSSHTNISSKAPSRTWFKRSLNLLSQNDG